ncbi:MAG: PAS domain S-box protein [Halobacterium sp.]
MSLSNPFGAVLDRVTDPVVVVQDGRVRFANESFRGLTALDDPAGVRVGELAPRDLAPDLEQYCADVADGDTPERESKVVLAGADDRRLTAAVEPVRVDHDGGPAAALVVDQSRTHAENEPAPDRYERLVEALPVAVCQVSGGEGGTLELVNDGMVAMFDADSKDDLVGRDVRDLFVDEATYETFSSRLQSDDDVTGTEVELETLDGETIWAAVTATTDPTRAETVYDCAVVDVTQRHEMAEALRTRARRFRRMFERHSAPMLLVDPDTGGIQNANEAAAEFYGYTVRELTGMTVEDLNAMPAESVAEERENARREDGNHFVFEHELADGSVRTVEVHSSPIELADDELLFSVVHDVTDREDYEARLETQRDNLEVLNQVLRHDVRNDLQVVLAYAEMLADEVPEDHREYVSRIRTSADHAVELTDTAREIANVMLASEANHGEVNLRSVLEPEIEEVQSSYPGAVIAVEDAVPAVDVAGTDMLDSVFRNLMKNAVQHNDNDVPEVTVSTTERGDSVVVRVADNGPGVRDGQKDDIFGKGEKGLESQGTGMGLYLVQTLVDGVDGEVWVEDNDPEGAVFAVELPKA